MLQQGLCQELNASETFFFTSIAALSAEDAQYCPQPGMYSVVAHLHHVAHSIIWFIDGAFKNPDGFDLDFPAMIAASHAADNFAHELQAIRSAYTYARDCITQANEADLYALLPAGPIMGGAPKLAVIGGITDHCAHHRGCLAVYTRLLHKVPPMPYA